MVCGHYAPKKMQQNSMNDHYIIEDIHRYIEGIHSIIKKLSFLFEITFKFKGTAMRMKNQYYTLVLMWKKTILILK